AADPPTFSITSAVADSTSGTDVAAIVEGTWSPLRFTKDSRFLDRDASEKPRANAPVAIPFTLALPKKGPAPLIFYSPPQPASQSSDVRWAAEQGLAHAGFAVIGFTDIIDRDIVPGGGDSTQDVFNTLLVKKRMPDYLSLLTHAEQL